jgi:hypothetical protein
LAEKGKKAAHHRKSTTDKKDRLAYSKLRVMIQKGEIKLVTTMMMGENQSSRSQVHVTELRGTEG